MRQNLAQEKELRRYLLGELTFEEQVLIEQRLFLENNYAELARVVEDDLIDDYVNKNLPANERARFETHFLEQPEHIDNLRIAEALKKYWAANPPDKDVQPIFFPSPSRLKPLVWFSLVAAGLLILACITWIALQSEQRERERPLQAEQSPPLPANQRQDGSTVPANSKTNRGAAARQDGGSINGKASNNRAVQQGSSGASRLAIFTIYPGGLSRSDTAPNRVSISSDVKTVTLKLPIKVGYDSYSAMLNSRRGTIQRWRNLNSETDTELGSIVRVDVAAALFSEEDYEIKLTGITDDSRSPEITTYAFRVEKK
jgi:hypothetical protein